MNDICQFALDLLHLDNEDEVQKVLEKAGFWTDPDCWRPLGDNSNNSGTVHAQQGDAFSALAEKLTNSIDEVLLRLCVLKGIDPTSASAPGSLKEAVALLGALPGASSEDAAESLLDWLATDPSGSVQLETARQICVSVTGPRDGIPSVSVADQGGGQTPDNVPLTFMSLHRGNKVRTPFLQGKFNMGGTGSLRFCSKKHHFQLIITRRDPLLLGPDASVRDHQWSVTIVRKREPLPNERASVYEYLAPVPGEGVRGVLSFTADSMPILPGLSDADAYERHVNFGTVIKLYQYEWDTSMASRSIAFRGKSVLTQLNCALPGLALPIRLCDTRGFKGHSVGFTILGMSGWFEHQLDRRKLEPECPVTGTIMANGFRLKVKAYVLSFDETRERDFKANFGVIYTINGQRHAHRDDRYFATKAVGLPRLAKKMVVIVECDDLNVVGIEDMFMSSRDRLADSALTRLVESELADWLRSNDVLNAVHQRHVEAEIAKRIGDDLPLKDVFAKLLSANPALADVFRAGHTLKASNGTGGRSGSGGPSAFEPKKFPTFFRFHRHGDMLRRDAAIGSRVYVDFETDAENQYLGRLDEPGLFIAEFEGGRSGTPNGNLGTLHQGALRFTLELPPNVAVNDVIKVRFSVTDDSQIAPFSNFLELTVTAPTSKSGGSGSGRRMGLNSGSGSTGPGPAGSGGPGGIHLPRIEAVHKENWEDGWNEETCLEAVMNNGAPELFRVNVDNRHLVDATRRDPRNADLVMRKFELGAALLAMSVVISSDNAADRLGDASELLTLETQISYVTSMIAPMLIPMLDSLGNLQLESTAD